MVDELEKLFVDGKIKALVTMAMDGDGIYSRAMLKQIHKKLSTSGEDKLHLSALEEKFIWWGIGKLIDSVNHPFNLDLQKTDSKESGINKMKQCYEFVNRQNSEIIGDQIVMARDELEGCGKQVLSESRIQDMYYAFDKIIGLDKNVESLVSSGVSLEKAIEAVLESNTDKDINQKNMTEFYYKKRVFSDYLTEEDYSDEGCDEDITNWKAGEFPPKVP